MIDKNNIEKLVNEFINGTEIFLVAVKVSSANRITVLADTMKGITIDECASISPVILKKTSTAKLRILNLQVSSPGLDMPFA